MIFLQKDMILKVSALIGESIIPTTTKKNIQKCFWSKWQSQKSILELDFVENKDIGKAVIWVI